MNRTILCLTLALTASCVDSTVDSDPQTLPPAGPNSPAEPVEPPDVAAPADDPVDPAPDPIVDPEVEPHPDKPAEAPFFGEWFRGLGATGPEWVRSVVADADGNVYIAGSFNSEFSVDGYTVTAVPGDFEPRTDTFVASYDASGGLRWITSYGSNEYEHPVELLVDTTGNVFVVGVNSGDLTFGSTVVEAKGSEDVHIVSYTNAGEFRWAESFGGPFGESPRAAAINDAGQIAITGSWQGLFAAGDTTLASQDEWSALDVFTMRYDTRTRQVDWVTGFSGFLIDVGTAVDISDTGEVVVGVSLQYDLTIDATTTFETGESFNGGIVKLDAAGQVAWSLELDADDGSEEVIDLAIDHDGNVFATGVFEGGVRIGGLELFNASTRAHDTWLAKLGADGTPVWANSYGGTGFDQPLGLAHGARGVYVTGRFEGDITLGGVTYQAAGEKFDVFVASFENDGQFRWARTLGSIGDDQPNGIALDAGRGVYVAGYTSGELMFNDEMQPAAGEFTDAFVLRMEEQ